MTKYVVKQFISHSQQFEPFDNGEYCDKDSAIAAAMDLVKLCGYKNIRVESEDGEVVFSIIDK